VWRVALCDNDAAFDYMKECNLPQIVIGKFKEHRARIFWSAGDWERHSQALGLSGLKVAPDPVLIANEAALWGAIRHQGLLPDTVIVSDDAGQFRVGVRAVLGPCRMASQSVPANDKLPFSLGTIPPGATSRHRTVATVAGLLHCDPLRLSPSLVLRPWLSPTRILT
jgi:hypothetical protein